MFLCGERVLTETSRACLSSVGAPGADGREPACDRDVDVSVETTPCRPRLHPAAGPRRDRWKGFSNQKSVNGP